MRSAPHGADLPAAPTSELIAAVERFATVAVVRGLALPVPGTPVRAVESLTNFVYSASRAEWMAKYSVLGLSKPSLVRWVAAVGGDLGRLAAAQREYLAGGDTEVHRELDDCGCSPAASARTSRRCAAARTACSSRGRNPTPHRCRPCCTRTAVRQGWPGTTSSARPPRYVGASPSPVSTPRSTNSRPAKRTSS